MVMLNRPVEIDEGRTAAKVVTYHSFAAIGRPDDGWIEPVYVGVMQLPFFMTWLKLMNVRHDDAEVYFPTSWVSPDPIKYVRGRLARMRDPQTCAAEYEQFSEYRQEKDHG